MDIVEDPDEILPGYEECMDEVESSLRCLVYWVLLPALCVGIAVIIAAVWLAANRMGG